MRVITTTVIRHAKFGTQAAGNIFDLDFDKGKILRTLPVPDPLHPGSNTNPRGGARGGRGIGYHDDHIYIANYDTIFKYTREWKLKKKISNPLSSGIHEIWMDDDGIWISATTLDLVMKMDFNGKERFRWNFREDRRLMEAIGYGPRADLNWNQDYRRYFDKSLDSGHVNCVVREGDRLIITLGQLKHPSDDGSGPAEDSGSPKRKLGIRRWLKRHSKMYKEKLHAQSTDESMILGLDIESKKAEVVFRAPTQTPDHNGVPLDSGTLLLNKTYMQQIYVIDRKTSGVRMKVDVPGNWLRGLFVLDNETVLVGTGPATVNLVDISKGKVLDKMVLSQDPNESIHGICVAE